jgi:hypothetical protein
VRGVATVMPELRLCTSTTVSVALKPFDYEVHGHDVAIEACWCGDLNRRVDVELLARKLETASKPFNRRPLWELLGFENATIEDLLLELSKHLGEAEGLRLCALSAKWASRSIILSF